MYARCATSKPSADFSAFTVQEYGYDSHVEVFEFAITEAMIGQTLKIVGRIEDFHQEISESEPLLLPIKGDQAPTIALSHPIDRKSVV